MNKVYDAFGNVLNVGDVIIVAVPLHWNGKGYKVAKGIVKGFTKNFVKYNIIRSYGLNPSICKARYNKVGKSFETYVPNCAV